MSCPRFPVGEELKAMRAVYPDDGSSLGADVRLCTQCEGYGYLKSNDELPPVCPRCRGTGLDPLRVVQ